MEQDPLGQPAYDDRSLEAAVTLEFSKYGTVFVKIRRDNRHKSNLDKHSAVRLLPIYGKLFSDL